MTDEMVEIALKLEQLAKEYRKLYESENGNIPVVWFKNNETGEGIFISDSFNTDRIKHFI